LVDLSTPDRMQIGKDRSPLVTAAQGGGLSLVGATVGAILGFCLHVLISRFYGPKNYGIFITCFLLCNILQSVAALGLHKAGMRFLAIGHERSDHNLVLDTFRIVAWIPFLFGLIIALIVYGTSSFIAVTCFHNIEMVPVLKLFSMAIPFFALLQVTAELSRGFKTTKHAVMFENLLLPSLQIVTLSGLYALGCDSLSAVYSFLLAVFACSLMMLWTVHKQIRNFIGPAETDRLCMKRFIIARNWKSILAYSLPLTPFALLFLGGNSMDIFMLNILTDSPGIGEYAAAARWVSFFVMILSALNFIFGPLIAGKLGINKMDDVAILYAAATRWMLFMSLPVSIFLILAREPMMLIFGEKFMQYGPTVLLILSLGGLFTALNGVGGLMFALSSHQYLELMMLSFFILLSVSLNILLIPAVGIVGAAIATIASNIATVLVRIFLIHRYLNIHPFSLHLVPPMLAFAVLSIGGVLLQHAFRTGNATNLGFGIGGCGIVLAVIVVAGLNAQDRDLFVTLKDKIANLRSAKNGTRTSTEEVG